MLCNLCTIDYNFQKELMQILSDFIDHFNKTNKQNKQVTAASIVVMDKTGGLLACISYPYYDIGDYLTKYNELATRPDKPLNNWALNGLYRPGSTFKPVVAAGALTEGIITPSSTVFCDGAYHYWPGWQPPPSCLQVGHHHVSLDLRSALKWSCNVYFYDTGRRLGIEKMDEYAQKFGLGVETGLEISNSKGRLTKKTDEDWQEGNVIQAAIGQMNTQVTPLQMALEAQTLANHGTRYNAHLIKGILSNDGKTVLDLKAPTVASSFDLSDEAFSAITDGMIMAGETIGRPNQLTDFGYQVAVKTGTPQTTVTKTNNGFISFAPVDDPEVIISCMIEGGSNSNQLIRRILLAYQKYKNGPPAESDGISSTTSSSVSLAPGDLGASSKPSSHTESEPASTSEPARVPSSVSSASDPREGSQISGR